MLVEGWSQNPATGMLSCSAAEDDAVLPSEAEVNPPSLLRLILPSPAPPVRDTSPRAGCGCHSDA